MKEIVLVMGFNGGGKTTFTEENYPDAYRLNRDTVGGKLDSLAPKAREALKDHDQIVMDNTYRDVESRKSILQVGKEEGVPVRCVWLKTSYEDAQFNACWRMMQIAGHILEPEEFKDKDSKWRNHPNLFPLAALFNYKNNFEKPTMAEGFSKIEPVKFERKWESKYKNKALFLDYDDTLRTSTGDQKWPERKTDIEILPNRKTVLDEWKEKGYHLIGVSNQSGVGKGRITHKECRDLFNHTNKLLGHPNLDYRFDISSPPPIDSYRRKPFPGMGVEAIWDYKLHPAECIMVGDRTSDRTFATRSGFQFQWAKDFFKDE
jgi:HAD superfamily hydrolase (TIGR01662 family)